MIGYWEWSWLELGNGTSSDVTGLNLLSTLVRCVTVILQHKHTLLEALTVSCYLQNEKFSFDSLDASDISQGSSEWSEEHSRAIRCTLWFLLTPRQLSQLSRHPDVTIRSV